MRAIELHNIYYIVFPRFGSSPTAAFHSEGTEFPCAQAVRQSTLGTLAARISCHAHGLYTEPGAAGSSCLLQVFILITPEHFLLFACKRDGHTAGSSAGAVYFTPYQQH